MNSEPKIDTKKPTGLITVLIIGIFAIIGLAIFIILEADETKAKVPIPVILIFILIFELGLLLKLFLLRQFKIYENRIESYSIFGTLKKSILISDITQWEEVEYSGKGGKGKVLFIYVEKPEIKIDSKIFKNHYEGIKTVLTKDKPQLL